MKNSDFIYLFDFICIWFYYYIFIFITILLFLFYAFYSICIYNKPIYGIFSDTPQPPEGPLTPSNVTKSSCQLQWRPPKDDGGSDITHYTVEKMDTDAMRWVPVGECSGTQMR